MREALQLHTSVVERGQTIRAVVRTITCRNSDGSEQPLIELDADTPCRLTQGVNSAQRSGQLLGSVLTLVVGAGLLLR